MQLPWPHSQHKHSSWEIDLKYKEIPPQSIEGQKIWSEESADATPIGQYDPWALVATVKVPGMEDITVSQLFSSNHCGSMDCPLKIMQGNSVLYEGLACNAYEHHKFAEEFNVVLACDEVIPLELK